MHGGPVNKVLGGRCIFVIGLCLTVSGCSWQSYNKDNPDEYSKYWENEENRKGSILYSFTYEYAQERQPPTRDNPPYLPQRNSRN